MRKDSRENHERLIEAAKVAIARGGVEVPAEEIAGIAGLSVATLYRHFPDRETLVAAVVHRVVDDQLVVLEEALTRDDPDEALAWFFEQVGEAAAASASSAEFAQRIAGTSFPADHPYLTGWKELLDRAQTEGSLRADVNYADVGFVTVTLAAIVSVTETRIPGFWRRHLRLLLDGLYAPPGGLPEIALDATLEDTLSRGEGPRGDRRG
jgi:AcrR family transcriptional regulator